MESFKLDSGIVSIIHSMSIGMVISFILFIIIEASKLLVTFILRRKHIIYMKNPNYYVHRITYLGSGEVVILAKEEGNEFSDFIECKLSDLKIFKREKIWG